MTEIPYREPSDQIGVGSDYLAAAGDGDRLAPCPSRREPTTLATLTSSGAVFVWAARVVWLVVAVLGGPAVGDALAGRSRAVQLTGTVGGVGRLGGRRALRWRSPAC